MTVAANEGEKECLAHDRCCQHKKRHAMVQLTQISATSESRSQSLSSRKQPLERVRHSNVDTQAKQLEDPMGTKWLLMATAVAFVASTGFAAAQQSPLPPAPADKVAPPTKDLNSPASPGVTGGAVSD